jgi:hypothetical protein
LTRPAPECRLEPTLHRHQHVVMLHSPQPMRLALTRPVRT